MIVLIGIAGYFVPAIRNAEDLLPDSSGFTMSLKSMTASPCCARYSSS
jgi:hypothetical protein